jgi:hypothetical protein
LSPAAPRAGLLRECGRARPPRRCTGCGRPLAWPLPLRHTLTKPSRALICGSEGWLVDTLQAGRRGSCRSSAYEDALELTLLVARKDTRRHPRVGARWLLRYLEEDPAATVEEAAPAASSLLALTGAGYQEAVQMLRATAERATRWRRESGMRSHPRA